MPTVLPVGLQMYTVRDESAQDFAGTLKQVAAIGYRYVELAGLQNHSAADVKKMLDDNGLTATSAHVPLDTLEANLPQQIADAKTLGYSYIVCPWLGENRRGDLDAYRRTGEAFTHLGQQLKTEGLQFAYHNHDFEFATFGSDTTGFDALFAASDPDLVKIELDTFWVQKAKLAPADYLRKFPGRTPIIHLKDMTPAPESTFAEVGEGVMDFKAIFDAAEVAGAKFYIVEQDRCIKHAPLESVRISFENLKKMGIVS